MLPKSLVVDLISLSDMPGKIEGVTIVGPNTIAVANDNDFDIGVIDASGRNQGKGTPSQILVVNVSGLSVGVPGMPRTGFGGLSNDFDGVVCASMLVGALAVLGFARREDRLLRS